MRNHIEVAAALSARLRELGTKAAGVFDADRLTAWLAGEPDPKAGDG
jgi:hypothetical protein